MHNHNYFMNIALKLALRAKGKTSPNPLVGAVVVKGSVIVGKGYHKKAGLPHAEIIALNYAGANARGSRLYVTMEPCAHFGRTPPCVNRIINSGVKEVFIGMLDPNPINHGKGIEILKANNIKVSVGFLEEELKTINRVFIKYITKGMPYITVKVAESLDGRIATKTGDSKWITSDKSRAYAHRIRKDFDAVMIGVNTVLRDNPCLDAWFTEKPMQKIIVDTQLSAPAGSNIFAKGRTIVVTLSVKPGQETENRRALFQKATILEVKEKDGQVNLKDMMKKLAKLGISNILVEGGGTLIGSLFDEGLVDRVMFFISPKIIGGKDAVGAVMGKGISRVDKAVKLKEIRSKRIGEDFLIEGKI